MSKHNQIVLYKAIYCLHSNPCLGTSRHGSPMLMDRHVSIMLMGSNKSNQANAV